MSSGPELVARRTRRAFREIAPAIVCREIDSIWQDEGFAPGPPNEQTGERRNLYQQYLDAVDWTDQAHVVRALRAFEQTARQVEPPYAEPAFDRLREDGYTVDDRGRVTGMAVASLRPGALTDLTDPSAIRDNLDRIQRAVGDGDDAQAIGSAKELVESTAKVVLRELGHEPDPKDDLPALVARAQTLLGVHPSGFAAGPDGSDAVKRILGGTMTVATGLAELRNRGYGTGHGPAGPRTGLGPRHARLAVGAARLWCDFVLDTLAGPGRTLAQDGRAGGYRDRRRGDGLGRVTAAGRAGGDRRPERVVGLGDRRGGAADDGGRLDGPRDGRRDPAGRRPVGGRVGGPRRRP